MGFLIGVGDFGLGDILAQSEALYNLLLDLCNDQLDWDNILNKPDFENLYFDKTQINNLLAQKAALVHRHDFSDLDNVPTTRDGLGLTDISTTEEIQLLLDAKAALVHTHEVGDINGLEDLLVNLQWEIVTSLPGVLKEKSLYFVKPTSSTRFKIYITTAGPSPTAVELDAVSYSVLSSAMNTKQDKFEGEITEYVRGDGSTAPFDKEALGLGNVVNLSPEDYPISDLIQAALNQKSNDNEVLKKYGNQVKESGVLTFIESPNVPTPTDAPHAVNKGYLDSFISSLLGGDITINGSLTLMGQFISTLLDYPAFIIASTIMIANLNADMVDGKHASDFALSTTQVFAGTGMNGGGPLSGNVTLNFDTTWGDARYSLSSHTHATLTRGTGLTGSNYNGSTGTTWAVSYGTTAGTAVEGTHVGSGDTAHAIVTASTAGFMSGAQLVALGNAVAASHTILTLGTANGLSLTGQQLSLQLATASVNGALSSTDWTTFNNKQAVIAPGTVQQYWRGDKSWQTLNTSVVPELTNLYFTTSRVLATTLSGLVAGTNTAITSANTILVAFQNLQAQISNLGTSSHAALTLGTTNGLSLAAGQILSLQVATGSVAGALSAADWTTFNGKQAALNGGTGYVFSTTGTIAYHSQATVNYWTKTGSDLYYLGKIGVGILPSSDLHVAYQFAKTDTTERVAFKVSSNDAYANTLYISAKGGATQSVRQFNLQTTEDAIGNGGVLSLQASAGTLQLGSGTGLIKASSGLVSYITDNSTTWNNAILGATLGFTGRIPVYTSSSAIAYTSLVYDGVNTRLGINNGAPTYTLDVQGDINTSSLYRVAGSSGSSGTFLKSAGTSQSWSTITTSDVSGLSASILGQILTGYTSGSNTPITSSNTVLTGFQNLQAQISGLGTSSHAALTLGTTNGLSLAGQVLSLQAATGSVPGALTASDWTTFNNKLSGSLTSGFIPKSNGGNTLVNSLIQESIYGVRVGTTEYMSQLNVSTGQGKTSTTPTGGMFYGTTDPSFPFGMLFSLTGAATDVNRKVAIDSIEHNVGWLGTINMQRNGGYVVIGADTVGTEKLELVGNFKYSGTLKPGGSAGTNGYFLKTNGSSSNSWAQISTSDISGISSYPTGSGTANTLAMFTGTSVLGNSLLSQSGVNLNVRAQFTSFGLSGHYQYGFYTDGGSGAVVFYNSVPSELYRINYNSTAFWYSANGSDQHLTLSKSTGRVSFLYGIEANGNAGTTGQFFKSAGGSTNTWGAITSGDVTSGLGYTPVSQSTTITIDGITFDLSTNRTWTTSGGGITGTGTATYFPVWNSSSSLANSSLSYSGSTLVAGSQFSIRPSSSYSFDFASGGNYGTIYYRNVATTGGWSLDMGSAEDFTFARFNGGPASSRFRMYAAGGAEFWSTVAGLDPTAGNHFTTRDWVTSNTLTASGTATLSNKSGNISQWTNDSGYITASSSNTLTNKAGNISQWTNNSGYITAATVYGQYSLDGGGNAGGTTVYLTLKNDQNTPGANKYYGTDASGTKGYFGLPSGSGVYYAGSYMSMSGGDTFNVNITSLDSHYNGMYAPLSRQIVGAYSINGGGYLSGDMAFTLVGDTASPGANMLYGTNGSGTRGWYSQPSGGGGGSVTSVGLTVPTGFNVTSFPVTSSGNLSFAFDSGYSLVSSSDRSAWNAAASSTITGSGQGGYFAVWTSTTNLYYTPLITVVGTGVYFSDFITANFLYLYANTTSLISGSSAPVGSIFYNSTIGALCFKNGSGWQKITGFTAM